jgi:hypothetical protein
MLREVGRNFVFSRGAHRSHLLHYVPHGACSPIIFTYMTTVKKYVGPPVATNATDVARGKIAAECEAGTELAPNGFVNLAQGSRKPTLQLRRSNATDLEALLKKHERAISAAKQHLLKGEGT